MEEIKAVLAEKTVLKIRDKRTLITLSGTFGLSACGCKEQNRNFLKQKLRHIHKVFDCEKDGRSELSNLQKTEIQCKRTSIFISFFGIPIMWKSRNDILNQEFYWRNFEVVGSGETSNATKRPKV